MLGVVIAIAVIVALVLISWVRYRLSRANLQSRPPTCCWCKKPIDENQLAVSKAGTEDLILGKSGMAHLECEEATYRRHRRYFLFFLVMGLIAVIPFIVETLHDLATGHKVTWHDVRMFGQMVFYVTYFPLLLYRLLKPWRRSIDQAKMGLSTRDSEQV